jgi:hypothetical protein
MPSLCYGVEMMVHTAKSELNAGDALVAMPFDLGVIIFLSGLLLKHFSSDLQVTHSLP